MSKNNINRLLHTIVPFFVMTMVQRLLLLVLGHTGMNGEVAELLAFLPSAAAAVLLFRVKTYQIYDEDEQSEIPPLVPEWGLTCVLKTLVTVAVMIVMMYAVAAAMGDNANPLAVSNVAESTLLSFASLIIVHPLVEEYLFRYLFYGELRLMNPIFGFLMQAVMFAIIHNTVDGMIYALVSGVALAVVYEQTGRILTSVAAHIIINLRSFLCLTVLSEYADICRSVDMVLVSIGVMAFLACGVIEGRRLTFDNAEKTASADVADDVNERNDDD